MNRLYKNGLSSLINSYKYYYDIFLKSSKNVKKIQEKKLFEIINKNKDCDFGKKHNFSKIKSIVEFQKNVSLSDYADYELYINHISSKKSEILTSEKIILFEPTSGSTSSSKLIPYTESLRMEFLAGIGPWLYSSYFKNKSAMTGRHYWSITPVVNSAKQESKSGIKIGFENDSYYLGDNMSDDELFVVPSDIKYIYDFKSFRYLTQLFLLKEKNLSFISVWNPSMIQVLFEDLDKNIYFLCEDISKGTFNQSLVISKKVKSSLLKKFSKDEKRAKEILAIYDKYKKNDNLFYNLFPKLEIISCWTHGNAKLSLDYIIKYFSKCQIQGKGLIATEGIVSIPFNNLRFPAVSILSHFFEFLELDKDLLPTGKILLTHQLKLNKRYCVIVTTSGGLYRYNLKDVVLVKGFFNQIPLIEFIGKLDNISDIMGEKLHELHVKESLDKVLKKNNIHSTFVLLAPERENKDVFYVLFIELSNISLKLKSELEKELLKNYHYAYCRKIGQLKPLKIFKIQSKGVSAYLSDRSSKIQLGNIKQAYLSKEFDWSKKFKGEYVK